MGNWNCTIPENRSSNLGWRRPNSFYITRIAWPDCGSFIPMQQFIVSFFLSDFIPAFRDTLAIMRTLCVVVLASMIFVVASRVRYPKLPESLRKGIRSETIASSLDPWDLIFNYPRLATANFFLNNFIILTAVFYKDFQLWEMLQLHICKITIIFHVCLISPISCWHVTRLPRQSDGLMNVHHSSSEVLYRNFHVR